MQSPPRFDALLATLTTTAVVAVTFAVEGWELPGAAAAALAVAMGVALWWRRRAPIAAGLVIAAASGLYEVVADEASAAVLPLLMLGFYSMGAYAPMRRAVAGLAGALALTFIGLLDDNRSFGAWLENIFFAAVVTSSVWSGGVVARVNRARTQQLAELAAQLEQEREEKARLAVAAERVRIARELHDVVAHAISVIAVQAGAGRHAPPANPQRTHDAFAAIESTARRALAEMRRLLDLLRSGDHPANAAPLPGLQDHEVLIEHARSAGLEVSVDVRGEIGPLPAGVDLAAYRVLQEALTNATKHALGARTQVRIRYGTADLELEVRNDGTGTRRAISPDGGHGLIGMRERVALYGGQLEAGPVPQGGFRVLARLPVHQDPS